MEALGRIGGARWQWVRPRFSFLVLGLIGGLALSPRWVPPGAVADAAPVAPAFAAHALGTLVVARELAALPAGGPGLGPLVAGTALRIGGRVRTPGGLAPGVALWVSPVGEAPARYGFVDERAVVVTAGAAPLVDLTGLSAATLTAPREAVARSGAAADGAALAPAALAVAPAALALPWLPASVARWSDLLVAAGTRHGVDPELLAIVALVESGGDADARSPSGALGLMQVMPATGEDIARERGIAGFAPAQLTEPAVNVDFGAYYIAQQLKAFGQADDPDWQRSVELAASAYNGGPGAAQRYVAGGSLPAETQRYQRWVGGLWRERRAASPPTLAAWLAAGGHVLVERASSSTGR
jgi:soluble lytic murein transglycosylase-like protein